MNETFKFYNLKPFPGLLYTLTSKGEVSLELTMEINNFKFANNVDWIILYAHRKKLKKMA